MGNAEAKELKYMSHGHELRWGNDCGRGATGQRRIKGRKKLDNCNSIINKYIFLKRVVFVPLLKFIAISSLTHGLSRGA